MGSGTADDSEASLSALGYSIDQLELLVVFKGDGLVKVRRSKLEARVGGSRTRHGVSCCVGRGIGVPG